MIYTTGILIFALFIIFTISGFKIVPKLFKTRCDTAGDKICENKLLTFFSISLNIV